MTATIAMLALALSVLSLGWQVWAHFLSGPRVKVSVGTYIPVGGLDHLEPGVQITARNVGRSAVTVRHVSIHVGQDGKHVSLAQFGRLPFDAPLPVRVEPGDEVSWGVPFTPLQQIAADHPRTGQWRAHVSLGNGRTARSSKGINI